VLHDHFRMSLIVLLALAYYGVSAKAEIDSAIALPNPSGPHPVGNSGNWP